MSNDPSKDLGKPPRKRRGRPPGSKNKKSAKSPMETAMAPAKAPAKRKSKAECCGKPADNHGTFKGVTTYRCVVCKTWWEARE